MRDFHHSVNVLVKAYLDNTLVHQNCYACAVGNLIADSNGYRFIKGTREVCWDGFEDIYSSDRSAEHTLWSKVFFTQRDGNQVQNSEAYRGETKKQIDSTGYKWTELAKMERAFESTGRDIFNGLMAVVDVLAEIHGIDLTAKEQAKSLFVKV